MMLAEVEESIFVEEDEKEMSSFNHSYICKEILRQLFQDENVDAFPELTFDIEERITSDISVYSNDRNDKGVNFSTVSTSSGKAVSGSWDIP